MKKTDFVIIGAGIVGLSIAIKLKDVFPKQSVMVLEKNKAPFTETSLYNSGVVHSGIHQEPDLLKSKLARSGGPMLIDFCRKNGVPFRKSGMLIAVAPEDLFGLWRETNLLRLLYKNSRQQKIPLQFLTGRQIKKMEPNVRAIFGLYLPEIFVVNQRVLGEKLFETAKGKGVEFIFNAEVSAINRKKEIYELVFGEQSVEAGAVINSAGMRADEISNLAGFGGYKIFPHRGEYYEVVSRKKDLIKSLLVYPALPPGHPVKGVHLTKTEDGRLLIGPNANPWPVKDDNFLIQSPPDEFLAAGSRFLPQLESGDLRWAYSGLRAKINSGDSEDDFIIKRETENPAFVNLIGIESPGFTASFAIAEYVARLLNGAVG